MSNKKPTQLTLGLKSFEEQSFVRYYNTLPEKSASTVRFFNRNEFYTVHGEDAKLASEESFCDENSLQYMGNEPQLSYIIIMRSNFEKFVRDLLLIRQYRVEVYVKSSSSNELNWMLEYKGSPGNLSQFEEILFDNNEIIFNSAIMAINVQSDLITSVASINSTEGIFYVCEFKDNELFTGLDALVAQINPKECVFPQSSSQSIQTVKNLLDRNGILTVLLKKSDFNSDDIEQDLNRLLYFEEDTQRNCHIYSETNLTSALGCLQALIKYLNLCAEEKNHNQFKLQLLNVDQYVRLDYAAIAALDLLPKPGTIINRKDVSGSVLQVLDRCCTPQGHRLLENWIKRPLKDVILINERLDVVEAFISNSELRNSLSSDHLSQLPDLLSMSKRLNNKKGTLQDCYRIYQSVNRLFAIATILRKFENSVINSMLLNPFTDLLNDMQKFMHMVEQSIDMSLIHRDEFLVNPSFSDSLQDLHDEKTTIEEKMNKHLQRAAKDLQFEVGKTIKLEYTDQYGYFFRVTLKNEESLRQNKNYRIIDVIKGGIRFVTSDLSDLSESYQSLNKDYQEEQKTIVKEILDVAVGYVDTLRNVNLLIAQIDVLLSFAKAATSAPIPYVRPTIHKEGTGVLKLEKVRHPCMEIEDTFIPNDVYFKQNELVLHIITGPNMGGKSTYMRSVAIAVLMAHLGSFVPCSTAEISVVDGILARVSASDSHVKGLSTFMLEMVEASSILKTATSNSLVIFDEVGRGTSTYDGFGIAWALVEHLATEIKCFSLFATHFHDITKLAKSYSTIDNWHVAAVTTETTITPLYQVKEGSCDKSYGIHCARMVKFPEDLIQEAIKRQAELEASNGLKYINDFEQEIKQKYIEEGHKIIKSILEEVQQIDENISDVDLLAYINRLRDKIPSDNLFIKGLLEP